MKAIVNTAPGVLELQELPLPQPGVGQVRIQTKACGICATEFKMIAGWERTGFPSVPGHEWSGVVDAVGPGVETALVGSPCVAENVLVDGGEVGFEHAGAYGAYFLTEARNLHLLPEGFPFTLAVLAEPLSVVIRAVRRLRLDGIERALVFGDGPIGLLSLLVLSYYGVNKIDLVGGGSERLALARQLGAEQVCSYRQVRKTPGELTAAVRDAFGNIYPCVVEASGSALAMEAALHLTTQAGQVLVTGDYDQARADFPWNFLLHNELAIIGSNAGAGAWEEAVRLLVGNTFPLQRLVTHTFPYERYPQAFDLVRSRAEGVVKAVLTF
jgi:threonine dehydrogenase-like Zn-dependent dehydrogenase